GGAGGRGGGPRRHGSRDCAREQPTGQGQSGRDGAMTTDALTSRTSTDPVAFVPGVRGHDACARHWLAQVTLRLRREVCWLWREPDQRAADPARSSAVPPPIARTLAALDLARYPP